MSNHIISQWLNLDKVEVQRVITREKETEIYLSREGDRFICSQCGRSLSHIHDSFTQRIRDLSVFEYWSYLILDKYRLECPHCGVRVERLEFVDLYSRRTKRFEEFVARLCKITSIKQVAELLELDWKTVKEIDKKYLAEEFAQPDYSGLRLLAVDEIASHKGHNYFTVVMDLEKTRVIWVGKNRRKETLDAFFREIGKERCQKLKAIACDMWDPYIASIKEYAPQVEPVFDKFHVIQKYSRVIDKVRNSEYQKADEENREIIKGTKYLLLRNLENLNQDAKKHLKELLRINEKLALTYILKDDLKRLWDYRYPECARKFLDSWIERAIASNIRPLMNFAKTLERYRYGLINHCRYPIDTAKLEGMNNKIKVIKRVAYGFHDDEYFILKIKQACS